MMRHTREFGMRLSLLATLLVVITPGCGGYGKVSPTAYDQAIALYSICNLRMEKKLDEMTTRIESAHTSGELTDDEASWLGAIVSDARQGNWEDAASAARRVVSDQAHPR